MSRLAVNRGGLYAARAAILVCWWTTAGLGAGLIFLAAALAVWLEALDARLRPPADV